MHACMHAAGRTRNNQILMGWPKTNYCGIICSSGDGLENYHLKWCVTTPEAKTVDWRALVPSLGGWHGAFRGQRMLLIDLSAPQNKLWLRGDRVFCQDDGTWDLEAGTWLFLLNLFMSSFFFWLRCQADTTCNWLNHVKFPWASAPFVDAELRLLCEHCAAIVIVNTMWFLVHCCEIRGMRI